MLNEECPMSKEKNIKVFFTDAFEIEEDTSDKTSENLSQLYTYAATCDDFCCEQTASVVVGDWMKQYDSIVKLFNENCERLDGGYKKGYLKKFKYIVNMKTVDQK